MMGGPEMAPQTPQRSGRPGEPGPPLDHSVLIGVDVGGTTIAAGAVTADGEVLHDESVLTHDAAAAGTLVTIERLVQRVSGALAARGLTVAGIGVGVPGPVDAGVVGAPAPHAADLVGQPLGPRLAAHFGVPVFRAAAEGELVAAAVVDEACRALGAMLATIVNGLNPEVVVVTGGVAGSLAALEKQILAAAAEHAFARALAATRITIVPGDKRLTMRGAAALVLYERAAHGG